MAKTPFSIGRYVALYAALAKDPRTSPFSKWLPIIALVYLLFPIDFVPDFIPFFGQLDDVTIIVILLWIAWKLIPGHIIEEQKRIIDKSE